MPEDKKPIQAIRGEIKYVVFIVVFVAGIIFNYVTVSDRINITDNKVNVNTYRITEIEIDRKEAWSKYATNCDIQIKQLEKINADLIKIKLKLDIDD